MYNGWPQKDVTGVPMWDVVGKPSAAMNAAAGCMLLEAEKGNVQ